MSSTLPLYILAGGMSRRFGTDKARAVLQGQSLLQRVAEQLLPTASAIWIVADQPGKYADLGLATIADPTPNRGPVNGLVTALDHRLSEHGPGWLVVAPCDLTTPAPHWIQPLLNATDLSVAGCATVYVDPIGRWQPLPCIVHTDVLEVARQAVSEERLSLCRFLKSVDAKPVPLPAGHDHIPNANTPQELRGH